jgi:hypothetical protein
MGENGGSGAAARAAPGKENKNMVRKFVATGAIAGALALAGVLGSLAVSGVAGAATSGSASTTAPAHTPNCTKAPARLARIAKLEAKAQAWLPQAQQRLTTAEQQGHPRRVARIERRIGRVERLEARGNRLQAKIEAACPGSSNSSS